jgi:hypothetical protein
MHMSSPHTHWRCHCSMCSVPTSVHRVMLIGSAWCCCTDMMGDAIDGAFEDDEDESDAIMSQVCVGVLILASVNSY